MEYVYGLLNDDSAKGRYPRRRFRADRLPQPLQQRTLELDAYTTTVLEDLGYDVLTSNVECCGMAGSFGYKAQFYELSMDVGYELADQFGKSNKRDRTVVASGTSCSDQLDALLDREPSHPVELIAPE